MREERGERGHGNLFFFVIFIAIDGTTKNTSSSGASSVSSSSSFSPFWQDVSLHRVLSGETTSKCEDEESLETWAFRCIAFASEQKSDSF